MRLPNGYGSVTKLSGNRRNPYWVRKTIGWTDKGYPIYKTIAYCPTRKEGLLILAKYNEQPWNVDEENITLDELYNLWLNERAPSLSKANRERLRFSYNHIKHLGKKKYKLLRAFDMQKTIDDCPKGPSTKSGIRSIWKHLDRFAFDIDIVSKMYSQNIKAPSKEVSERTPFTHDEINQLWKDYNEGVPNIDIPLIFIYSGFRISELQFMKIEDVDLENMTFKGGSKTAAGKNRIVPIHSKIQPLVRHRVEISQTGFLFEMEHKEGHYKTRFFRKKFHEIMEEENMNHVPHECRHTFRTLLDEAGANKKCIDMMMGHHNSDIGLRIYTHKTLEELRDSLELVTQ